MTFGDLVANAGSGALRLRLDPQAFLDIDHACAEVIAQLDAARVAAGTLGGHTGWGLGEDDPRLRTAVALVRLLREQAAGIPGSAEDTLTDHLATARELRELFAAARAHLERTDADFARDLRALHP